MSAIEPGLYRHYKGGTYFVLGTARHSEIPDQLMVIYANSKGENWARPAEMWSEEVTSPENPDLKVPRFQKL